MATTAEFRRIALAMPGAVAGEHHGHPDFRANGRIFASLTPDGERGMVRVALDHQKALVASSAAFTPANGAWGRQGCTMVALAAVDAASLRAAVEAAWQATIEAGSASDSRQTTKATRRARKAKAKGAAPKPSRPRRRVGR